ncbi:MAG TPA: hypothetical protein VEG64_10555 [Candidatus Sulfotelmatobacter sp.]|nr:hypothetical protein [Candidatus Sulfotelmatobacter sp.]
MISRAKIASLALGVIFAVLLNGAATRLQSRQVLLSVPDLRIAPDERVVAFHIDVVAGRIVRITDMPIGWNISINNDPSWNTQMDASVIVAAAALNAFFFKDFAVVEQTDRSELPFEVKGEVSVSRDFSQVRRIQVGMKDFAIRQMAPTHQREP